MPMATIMFLVVSEKVVDLSRSAACVRRAPGKTWISQSDGMSVARLMFESAMMTVVGFPRIFSLHEDLVG